MTMAVAGRREVSQMFPGESTVRKNLAQTCWSPRRIEGSNYMRRGSYRWGGLGGYPITPRTNVPFGMRGTTTLLCMPDRYRPRRVVT
jgi:hypothetical protein